jgi:hypothetical protein
LAGFPSAVQGQTVNVETCVIHTCAVSIEGLNVNGTIYDVAFVNDTFSNLNDGTNFSFLGDAGAAESARAAVLSALITSPDSPNRVSNGSNTYLVAHSVDPYLGLVSAKQGTFSVTISGWAPFDSVWFIDGIVPYAIFSTGAP